MATIDIIEPRHRVRIDTLFWKHASPFLGSQEQLDELKADVNHRVGARFHAELTGYVQQAHATARRSSILDHHRPATKRLTPILHVGLIPMLWTITTCACGQRWPCNDVKQHLRTHLGWTVDITHQLKTITHQLPKPRTRLTRLRQLIPIIRRPRTKPRPTAAWPTTRAATRPTAAPTMTRPRLRPTARAARSHGYHPPPAHTPTR